MSKAMEALDRLADTIGGCTCSMCTTNREDAATLRDYITTTEARLNATPASSGKTKAEERDDISIHMQMLCTDDMRADACADAKAHDLPFQVFRILGGYSEALDRLTKSAARIKELEEALRESGASLEAIRTSLAGYAVTKENPYPSVVSSLWREIQRMDGRARSGLACLKAALSGARKVEP